jgi:anti-anti-sigma factor
LGLERAEIVVSAEDRDQDGGAGEPDAAHRAFEEIPVATASVAGPDFEITACNAAFRALLRRAELVGRRSREVFPEKANTQLFDVFDRVYSTGETAHHLAWRFPLDLEGTGYLVDVYMDFTATPYRGGAGNVEGLHLTLADVTEQTEEKLRAQEEAREARKKYAQALDVITALQDALLPDSVPVLPGVDLAANYLLADADGTAGGDWFDTVVRPNGAVALVTGDVVGHGVPASAVMGQLRAIMHNRLLVTESIPDVLSAVDRFARTQPESHATTVCVAVIQPDTGELEYVTAGHPPPLLVTASGEPRFLPPTGAGPLTTGTGFATGHDRLELGDLLLLYTDGVVERPGRSTTESMVELSQVAALGVLGQGVRRSASHRRPARVCQHSLELLTRETGYADDITLLAAERVQPIAPLTVTLAADAASVARARDEVARWLDVLEVRPLDELAVQHVVGELVTNAVEHAYVDDEQGNRIVTVGVRLGERGDLVLSVADAGKWREPAYAAGRGNGLAMVRGFVDSLQIHRTGSGTTAVTRQELSRPAELLTAATPRPARRATPGRGYALDAAETSIKVSGSIDQVSADQFRVELMRSARGGMSADLVVDLSNVTYLGSAGVQVLHELRALNGETLTLVAPAGSVAQHVLELVRLPYVIPRTEAPEE